MSKLIDWLHSIRVRFFSKPTHERTIFRFIHRERPARIVEIGLVDGKRAERLIRFSARCANEDAAVQYCGIDWFEAGEQAESGWSLKSAHQKLSGIGAKIRLLPGDPLSALSRHANSLVGTDLVIISSDQDAESLERAWFYLPRMFHSQTAVFVEEQTGDEEGEVDYTFRRLTAGELEKLAGSNVGHISKAA